MLKEDMKRTDNILPVKQERQSGLEMLRIIAMLFILMHHCALYCGYQMPSFLYSEISNVLMSG
jgi:surface polysaccharide O-acyltransferase-like enzyme